MNLRSTKVSRGYIADEVICAIVKDGLVLHLETRKDFKAGEYAKEAFYKYKRCRVLFYRGNEHAMWREVRWKNANTGTMYHRPNFKTVSSEEVPPELQVAVMCL